MCSPKFGLGKQIIHDERVAYDHSCGNVQPGDDFTEDVTQVTCDSCKRKFNSKILYIIETGEREVLITTDKSKYPDAYMTWHVKNYPRMAKSIVSDFFQWAYIDAYLNDKEAKWTVTMDEDAQKIWDARPAGFENRHQETGTHPVEEVCPYCGR